ncbi:hypothetical protein VNO77_41875 [Canavalia gladiata]|uniref:Transposase n=1 Tax=Canavalia gladiata TaxID=3824 RepID=A0AAN9K0L1_CANGL
MDRKWMSANRLSDEYENGVKFFIKFAIDHAENPNKIICPCLSCCYSKRISVTKLEDHLVCYGIDQSYTCCTRHGETRDDSSNLGNQEMHENTNTYEDDQIDEIENTVEEYLRDCPEMFESFTELLTLLKDILPEENALPSRTYEAKKMLCSIGMSYERIHACRNDCILFRKEYAYLKSCPKCNVMRYKKKESTLVKVVWYFPIIPRFRRMYRSLEDSKHLTWHADNRIKDGKLRHPADSPQWSKIDHDYPNFGQEPRNLRLALSTDGMNPHGLQSNSHRTWPVILIIYNLPPWLCMKRKFMMLSMLISGPTQPGNDIDVYLAPLIEDLKQMWEVGVEVYDGYREESFLLRAMLFGTINDFPAYGNLSGYSIKGQCACPICEENTDWKRLQHCKKNVFLGHRRFLHPNHPYRGWKRAFNGNVEYGTPPIPLIGDMLYEKVKDLKTKFGKPFAKDLVTNGWKKKSIFFELPYWKSLYVRHFLDVMHIEKNVCESLINTLLNVKGKSKDGINSRLDLIDMGIRTELGPIQKDKSTYLPPAAHTLSKQEKITFCKFLDEVKVPEGYSSNIRNLISVKDLKLKGLKSHDYHVLMEHLLPVGIRSILPPKVRGSITKLCFFFRMICSKVLDPARLPSLRKEIITTLCELEMYFPPSFFDIMVHLTIHLVTEIQLCGPVYIRWMYPIERYMKILKGYVKNRSRPEGCIVERYIVEEAVEFCTEYLSNVDSIGLPKSRHQRRTEGEGIMGNDIVTISRTEWEQAHLYVLHNTNEVEPFIERHKNILRSLNPNRNENWITREHNREFITWLKENIFAELAINPSSISENLRRLASGPSVHVISYSGYLINGYTFYTKEQDSQSTMQNSGVTLVAQSLHVSSSKDQNPIYANMSYFGVIQQIWELDYTKFRVPMFGCKWVDNNNGVRIDESGFLQVDFNKEGYKNDPFILTSQAQQVFYVTDPIDKKWSIVLVPNKIYENHDHYHKEIDIEDCPFLGISQLLENGPKTDDNLYMRYDHDDVIWINPLFCINKRQTSVNPTRKRKRKSRTGYARLEQKMLQETGSNATSIPRHILWKAARVNKKGVIDNEKVAEVWAHYESLSQLESQELNPHEDILAKALNVPEYPGRVRGVGQPHRLRYYSMYTTYLFK